MLAVLGPHLLMSFSCFSSASNVSSSTKSVLLSNRRSANATYTNEQRIRAIGPKPFCCVPPTVSPGRPASSALQCASLLCAAGSARLGWLLRCAAVLWLLRACSTASFSTPSGFSSSKRAFACFASTKVTMPSSRANSLIDSSCARANDATGAGQTRERLD